MAALAARREEARRTLFAPATASPINGSSWRPAGGPLYRHSRGKWLIIEAAPRAGPTDKTGHAYDTITSAAMKKAVTGDGNESRPGNETTEDPFKGRKVTVSAVVLDRRRNSTPGGMRMARRLREAARQWESFVRSRKLERLTRHRQEVQVLSPHDQNGRTVIDRRARRPGARPHTRRRSSPATVAAARGSRADICCAPGQLAGAAGGEPAADAGRYLPRHRAGRGGERACRSNSSPA